MVEPLRGGRLTAALFLLALTAACSGDSDEPAPSLDAGVAVDGAPRPASGGREEATLVAPDLAEEDEADQGAPSSTQDGHDAAAERTIDEENFDEELSRLMKEIQGTR